MPDRDNDPVVFPAKLPRRDEVGRTRYEQIFEQVLLSTVDQFLLETMRFALTITRGNEADAHELVQEAFAKLLAQTFNRPTNGRAWATVVVRNAFLDRWRRGQTEVEKLGHRVELTFEVAETHADSFRRDVADHAVDNVFVTPIRQAASKVIEEFVALHEPSDTARVLRATLDTSTGLLRSRRAVAELTGLHESTVQRLRAPALKKLKAELQQLYKELQAGDGDVTPEFLTG